GGAEGAERTERWPGEGAAPQGAGSRAARKGASGDGTARDGLGAGRGAKRRRARDERPATMPGDRCPARREQRRRSRSAGGAEHRKPTSSGASESCFSLPGHERRPRQSAQQTPAEPLPSLRRIIAPTRAHGRPQSGCQGCANR
ncbi:MAG: hypothetical protein ACYCSN_19835, partial [Acidobacteriaceae bacterium]